MRLSRRLFILAPLALIGAAVVAVVVFIATIDPNDYRDNIAAILQEASGRPVALRGPLEWSLGLTPTVRVEDVVIGDPTSPAASSLQIGKLEVALALVPLITQRVVQIRSLALDDVAVVADVAAPRPGAAAPDAPAGVAPPAASVAPPEASAGSGLPQIDEIYIRNASVTIRDRGRERTWRLLVTHAEVRRHPPLEDFSAEGRIDDRPFTAAGRTGLLMAIGAAAPWPVDLTLRVGELGQVRLVGSIANAAVAVRPDLTLTVEGAELQRVAALAGITVPALGPFRGEIKVATNAAGVATVPSLDIAFGRPEVVRVAVRGSIAEPEAQRGFDLRVSAEGREIGALAPLAAALGPGPAIPPLGPFQVQAHVVDGPGGPGLDDLRAQVGSDGAIKLVVAGRVARLLVRRGFALDVQLQAPDAAALARLAHVDAPLRGVVALQARISDPAPGSIRFENLHATIGPDDATGDVTVALGGARPTLSGELASNRIDLASLGIGQRRGQAGDARVFSDAPLPFDVLALADADLRLRAARVDGAAVALRNVAVTVALHDGELAARPLAAELGGGQVSGELMAAARGTVNLQLSGHNINMGALLREMRLSDKLDGGRAEYGLELRGNGRSLRAIMATANGTQTLIVRGGTVDNRFFEIIGADVVRWLAQMVSGAERPTLNCMVNRFDIRDGLATARVLMFDTSQITAAGEGTINLGTEALALRLQPRPRNASLLSFAVPLEIGGTLGRPTFLPHSVGAIGRTAATVGTSVVLSPIGAILSIADIGQTRADPCSAATALAQGQAPRAGAPQQPAGRQNPIDQIGDGIGRGLRGIFGR